MKSPMTKTLGIIAGEGEMPITVMKSAVLKKIPFVVLNISKRKIRRKSNIKVINLTVGEIGKGIDFLKKHKCQKIVFAGKPNRPKFSELKIDYKGLKYLPKIMSSLKIGDSAIFSSIINIFESQGFQVIAPQDIADDLVSKENFLTNKKPNKQDILDIKKGISIMKSIGKFDIGQAIIVSNGLTVAIEGIEGTDLLIKRSKILLDKLGSKSKKQGVLVKLPKPTQDRRIDLPTIGTRTVKLCQKINISGIAIQSNGTIILEKTKTIKSANQKGLFLFGF